MINTRGVDRLLPIAGMVVFRAIIGSVWLCRLLCVFSLLRRRLIFSCFFLGWCSIALLLSVWEAKLKEKFSKTMMV